ncbi:MAG: hypothetical protein OEU95_04515 [Nitrospirota bacterium]|nr:hypothetical protein [Nitrospirota bacterium]
MPDKEETKKHPCPDCLQCQWCSDQKCSKCRPQCKKDICNKQAPASGGK